MRVRREVGVAILVLSLILIGVTAAIKQPTSAATRPNVLLIVTDDQIDRPRTVTAQIMRNLPGAGAARHTLHQRLRRELVVLPEPGEHPQRPIQPYQRCLDHRRSLQSASVAKPREFHPGDLAARAGYRTGLVGKYLNEYGATSGTTYIPTGWDDWHAIMNLNYPVNSGYYDYDLNENGQIVRSLHPRSA
jgi:N-acetylglucosamine-6-sulfatase